MKKTLCSIILIILAFGLASCSRGSFISQHGGDIEQSAEQKRETNTRTAMLSRNNAPERSERRPSRRTKKSKAPKRLLGGIATSEIAGFLNDADKQAAGAAEYRALEFGNPGVATPWRNPRNGKYGNVVASKPFKQMNIHCRQYTHTIYINGRPEITRKTACRNKDGSWQDLG